MEQARPTQPKKELAVDERLVVPEQRAELLCGALIMTPPAGEPHARKHIELGALLQAHVASGYLAALYMLTRTSETSDFAPDASIYPEARDPEGHRQLEVMAFEIVSEQRRSVATRKAHELTERGVASVYCVDLNTGELLSWSGKGWMVLDEDAHIQAACLHSPLPVRAVLHAAESDDAVVRALRRRGNAALLEIERARYLEGQAEAELRSLVLVLEHQLGRALSESEREGLGTRLEAQGHDALMKQLLNGALELV